LSDMGLSGRVELQQWDPDSQGSLLAFPPALYPVGCLLSWWPLLVGYKPQ